MATYNAYAPYFIFFCDQHEYDFALAVTGGSFITLINPEAAAAIFGISWPPSGSVQVSKGIYGIAPYGIPGPAGVEIKNPAPSGVFLKTNLDSVTVPGQVGVPNIFGTGPDLIISWVGVIIKGADVFNRVVSPITVRRWIGGMETARLGEGGTSDVVLMTRDASRFGDGFGLAVRGGNIGNLWQRRIDEYTGVSPRGSAEVFYFRIRTLGSVDLAIWRCRGSVSVSAGACLKILTDGRFRLVSIDAGGVETALATTLDPLDMNTWYRISLGLNYNSGIVGEEGAIVVALNNVLLFGASGLVGTGLGQVQFHASSDLGKVIASADTNFEVDLDDWANMAGADSFAPGPAIDSLMGSHIFHHFVESGTSVGWTGAIESANQNINPIANLNSLLTSAIGLSLLDLVTDLTDVNLTAGMDEGKVAGVVSSFSSNSGGTDGKLGYNAAGLGNVLTTVNQTPAGAFQSILFMNPLIGLAFPPPMTPLNILHEKSNDGNTDSTRSLGVAIEHIGVFGKEDAIGSQFFPATLLHNCRYANTAWGYIGAVPTAPVYAVGGTYVGNGLSQVINLPAACHFLWIRALAGGSAGIKWFGAGIGGHFGIVDRVVPNAPVRVWIDSTGQCKFSVAGTDVDVNANLANYQYIAFCDPGMRFNICGAFQHPSTLGLGVNPFPDTTFIPSFAFAQQELTESVSSNVALSCKGPGHTGNNGTLLNGTNLANWGSYPLLGGELDSGSSLHGNNNQTNYSVWRAQDVLCTNVMIQTGFYVGDGTGARTFSGLTPTSNRFPLFVFIQPHNAVGFFKDPSHAGANSSNVQTLANSATAITAVGVDSFTVGATLNANGIIYEFFIICGDSAGFNNGTFGPPNCEAPSDFFIPPTAPPDDIIAVAGDGGLLLGAAIAITILKDVSGLYKLTPGKLNDTVYNRISGASTEVQAIPNPSGRTAFISG